ncbi:MAG: hypothetical protein K2N13_02050 [Paraprevotella sp.]|nr:hypothetical protein [Paraprevotella sp.]
MKEVLTYAQEEILSACAKKRADHLFLDNWVEYNESYDDYNDCHGDYYDAE